MSERDALVAKAERYLRSAALLAGAGDWDSAVSRVYYGMFYLAEALLDAKGLSFSSHRGVISGFGREFAKTGEMDAKFHRALITAFEKRQISDYEARSGIGPGDVGEMGKIADDFLKEARDWLARRDEPRQGSGSP